MIPYLIILVYRTLVLIWRPALSPGDRCLLHPAHQLSYLIQRAYLRLPAQGLDAADIGKVDKEDACLAFLP